MTFWRWVFVAAAIFVILNVLFAAGFVFLGSGSGSGDVGPIQATQIHIRPHK